MFRLSVFYFCRSDWISILNAIVGTDHPAIFFGRQSSRTGVGSMGREVILALEEKRNDEEDGPGANRMVYRRPSRQL